MELKTKYQYTYFIYPYIVNEKNYEKYLYKLLMDKNYTMKVSTRKPNLPLKSWSNKRQAIPPIIIGMASAATRPVI